MAYTPSSGINQGGIVQPTDVPSITPQPQHPVPYGQGKWIEPKWDLTPQAPSPSAQQEAGMPPITNPIELAQWHDQQENMQLGQFDQQLAAIQAPVQSALATSYDQYKIDFAAIQNSQMDAQQKADRLKQLNANYQKKWIGIKGKTQLEEQAIQQQKQQAAFSLKLQQAMRMKEIQTYAALAENGTLSPEDALRLQYKTLGYDVPITAMRPPKSQTPYEQLQKNSTQIKRLTGYLNQFEIQEAKDRPFKRWDRPRTVLIQDPQTKTGKRPATPDEVALMEEYTQQVSLLRQRNHQLSQQFVAQQVPDLAGTAAPLAQGIMQARPSTSTPRPQAAADVSSLSTEELLRIVGGQ